MTPLVITILWAWGALIVGFVLGALWAGTPRGDIEEQHWDV